MRLFGYWRSSSSWRVRIALAYKNLAFELVPIHLLRHGGEQHEPAFRDRNLMSQVPVLELSPTTEEPAPEPWRLTQSMAILEYLEEAHPHPPLLPSDVVGRARARQLAEIVNSGIQPLQNLKVQQALRGAGVDPAPLVRGFVATGLAAIEDIARSTAGRFLVGDQPTIADVYLVPQLFAARRVELDLRPFPTLLRIESTCEALPAFAAAHPSAQPDREDAPSTP
jgi:maleylpyruvate isomerase